MYLAEWSIATDCGSVHKKRHGFKSHSTPKGNFEMIGNAIDGLVILFFIQIPLSILGIWKLIEIIIYLFQNVHITFG